MWLEFEPTLCGAQGEPSHKLLVFSIEYRILASFPSFLFSCGFI
jgi:hypothetical protein